MANGHFIRNDGSVAGLVVIILAATVENLDDARSLAGQSETSTVLHRFLDELDHGPRAHLRESLNQ